MDNRDQYFLLKNRHTLKWCIVKFLHEVSYGPEYCDRIGPYFTLADAKMKLKETNS